MGFQSSTMLKPSRLGAIGILPAALALLLPAARALAGETDSYLTRLETLPNGLRVVASQAPDARLAEVRVFQAITAAHEPVGQEGIAHLVEHLSFEGRSAEPDSSVARALALLSCQANASTGAWGVEYETACLPSLLPQVLAIEARRLARLDVPRETFEREKQVVLQEIAMRSRMSVGSDLLEELFRAAYAGGPYGARRIGTDSTVARLTLEDVVAFHATASDPRIIVLSIEGPLPVQQMVELARVTFGPLVAHGDAAPLPPVGKLGGPRATPVLDRFDATGVHAALGFRLPRATPSEKVMAALLRTLLEREELRCGIVTVPGEAFLFVGARTPYMTPPADADPAAYQPEELGRYLWGHLWKQVQEAADAGLRPKDFEALKPSGAAGGAGQLAGRNVTTMTLVRDLLAGDDLRWLAHVDSLLAAVDLATFTAYVRGGIRQAAVKGVAHGRDSGRPQSLQLAGRGGIERLAEPVDAASCSLSASAITPVLEAFRQVRRRTIDPATLSNGIPLLTVSIAKEPQARVGGVRTFGPPKWTEPGQQPGITLLYPPVASSQSEYAEAGPRPLPHFASFHLTPTRFEFEAEGASARVGDMASTLARRITQPELSVQRWTFELEHARTKLDLRYRTPAEQASWSRFASLLGARHPLLGTWAVDPRTIGKLNYDRLRDAHQWLTRTGNLRLLVAGSIAPEDARAALEEAFGRLPAPDSTTPPVPLSSIVEGMVGRVVPGFDRRDCAVVLSMPPVAWDGPRPWSWEERALLRELVRARVRARMREQEGLSYWMWVEEVIAGSSFVLEVGLSTFCESSGRALALTREELRSLASRPPTADEWARAQLKLAGSVAWQLESADRAFEFLQRAARAGAVPVDPVLAVLDADADRVAELLRVCIQSDRFAFTVEGPLLEEAIEELKPRP